MYQFAKSQPLNSKISDNFWNSAKLFLKSCPLKLLKQKLLLVKWWYGKLMITLMKEICRYPKNFFSIKFLWFAKQLNTSPKYVMLFTCCKRCIWNFWVYIWQPTCSCWRSQIELETCEQDCAHMCCYVALQGLLWKDDKFVTRNKFII